MHFRGVSPISNGEKYKLPITRAWVAGGKCYIEVCDLPSKKISLQKIFGLNLTLRAREACGIALNQWTELRSVQKNFSENELTLKLEPKAGIGPATYSLPWSCSTN